MIRDTEALMKKQFIGFGIATYGAPPSARGMHTHYALIRVAASDWPDEKLSALLQSLPPNIRIVINPDRII